MMLPYFKSWYIKRILEKKKRLSEDENDIMELIYKLEDYRGKYENYDYDYGILIKELNKLRRENPDVYKNNYAYNNLNLKLKGVEANRDRAFDECVKLDEKILDKANKFGTELEDIMALDYKRASGKSAFRTGASQGKDVIKNMNRMTETAVKRFRK